MSSQPRARYVSSSGNIIDTVPLTTRLSRFGDDVYNFLGLYFTSLFSMDPFTAAQNSRFNTQANRGGGSTSRSGTLFQARSGGGASGGSGGSGNSGSRGTGRRIGTVNDVRGPECGSCG